jgi:hypothetical protein
MSHYINRKRVGTVNFKANNFLWRILDDIHMKYGVNKSEFVKNYLYEHITRKEDFLIGKYSKKVLEREKIREQKLRRDELVEQLKVYQEKMEMLDELIAELEQGEYV